MSDSVGESGKLCPDCQQVKPLTEFSKDLLRKDGLSFYCGPCRRVRERRSVHARRGRPPLTRHPVDVDVPAGHKWCPDCDLVKPFTEFPRMRSSSTGYATYCKPCHNARGKQSRDKVGGSRTYHLKRRYGVTQQEVEALITAQGGRCAICREAPAEHVDHDHESGRVRGVLCFNCNGGLGQFRDRLDVMASAIAYLQGVTWAELLDREGVFLGISSQPVFPRSPSS
jgi:Recombination endonuclease VII